MKIYYIESDLFNYEYIYDLYINRNDIQIITQLIYIIDVYNRVI